MAVDFAEGKAIYESNCKNCHGGKGEGSLQLHAPALAGLEAWYVYRQVNHFRNGIRGYDAADTLSRQMSAMVKILKDTARVRNVAAYIESLPVQRAVEKVSGNWKNGENIYQSLCGSCHGPLGKGNRKLDAPPLRSLDSWYLKSQFEKFKDGTRGAHEEDKFGAQMASIAMLIKDEQSLTDIITYLRSEQPSAK